MRHEFDQGQVRALAPIVGTAADRFLRSRALSAAVAFHHMEVTAGENPPSPTDVLYTAVQFEEYIKDGKVE